MAKDDGEQAALAARMRSLIGMWPDVEEKRMFGGIAFLLNGHILIAASRQGGALVQVGKARNDEALARPGATQMVMRGTGMPGFIHVAPDELESEDGIRAWVALAEPYVRSLSPK